MAGINREFFFDQSRSDLFSGSLKKSQVDGLNFILDAWEAKHAKKDDRWLAYVLATTHHETDRKIQPIHEYGGSKYWFRMYDRDGDYPARAATLGNTEAGDGVKFHGRGFVQLTGRRNYKDMSTRIGVDMIADPDAALEPVNAAQIILIGMERGTFTGKKLADYFDGAKQDWKGARRIVNGQDKADLIAGIARKYYAAISYTTG